MKVLIFAVALFAVLGWWSAKSYDGVHYVGETEITPEQYVNIASNQYLNRDDNFVVADDKVIFTYDFYVFDDARYDYLQETSGGLWDTPLFYRLKTVGLDMISGASGIAFLSLLAVFGVGFYLVRNRTRGTYRFFIRLAHRWQHWRYPRLPDTGGNILTNAGLMGIGDGEGIICIRSWRIDRHYNLKSMVMDTIWDDKELEADKEPERDGLNGVNAYRIGAQVEHREKVMGLVELDGHFNYHSDGVVRAEHCKILGLFISKGCDKLARHLSDKYQVPAFLDDTPIEGYYKWLYSDVGINAMQRNNEILRGEKQA